MNHYFYLKLKIGGSWFYIRSITWFKNFEPTFEPVFVTNIDLAGLFFKDQVKKVLDIYPDLIVLTRARIGKNLELVEVEKNQFAPAK